MLVSKCVVWMFALSLMAPPAERPPELTFDKHVDYIGWWKREFAAGSGENARELYSPVFPDADLKGGLPSMEGVAREEYDRWDGRVWQPEEFPAIDAYLQSCESYIKDVEKATKVNGYWEPLPDNLTTLYEAVLPGLSTFRAASRAIMVRAWRKQDRQGEAVIDATRTLMRIADHAEQQPWTISGLVGAAIRNLAYTHIRVALDRGVITGDQIKSAYDTLREFDPGPLNWNRAVTCEWAICLDMLQSVCNEGEVQLDRWKAIEGAAAGFDPVAARGLAEQHFKAMLGIVANPIDAKTATRMKAYGETIREKMRANDFNRVMCTNLERAYDLTVRVESHRGGTMIALALYTHHAKHGEWPKRLKDLDKNLGLKDYRDYGKDPYTGKLFKYKLVDGKPLLYSIGADGKDDGGRHDSHWGEKDGGDFVFVPYQD
ncbi:MAG: hypothetical protein H6819_00970 [Phycisphaerales bacterium]|nr:hypothetical protein [Phycisphaerales bacterium]MCB9857220.1 hypothetical protein [Phycisphaerales bacterium]MCB9863066.1 hypothetical protein [Phycisphaerales bacterium]